MACRVREEAPGEDREVPGRQQRAGEKAGRYQAAGGVWGLARRGAGYGASARATALELRSVERKRLCVFLVFSRSKSATH